MKQYLQRVVLYAVLVSAIIVIATIAIYTTAAVPDKSELLLRFKQNVSEAEKQELSDAHGIVIKGELPEINVLFVSAPGDALPTIFSNPHIEFVEENQKCYPLMIPDDTYYGSQWHLDKIGAPEAWDITTGNPSVIIAILDTGVDTDHPDLEDNIFHGRNLWKDYPGNIEDVHGHGTATAGTAAAVMNNGIGVASIAGNCRLMPIRVSGPSGWSNTFVLSEALIFAAKGKARVASISYDVRGAQALSYAAKYFRDQGGLVFCGGGNYNIEWSDGPNPYVISVSGTTQSDIASTTYGPYIDLSAPVSVYTTKRGGGYGSAGGTSFSTPLAAGVAALMFSVNPALTPDEAETILFSTADDLGDPGYDIHYGWGRINASRAVLAAKTSIAVVKPHPTYPPHPTPKLKS
ncbi:MAG: S8 family serine peptidase [Candidatus Methanospirareceae archaeon]